MAQIAILAMDGRFPGEAGDLEALWTALVQGRDLIQPVPASRWRAERYHHAGAARGLTHISSWGGFLDRIDLFDPVAFGISPREAQTMDPSQRLLLEAAQRCWEGAGFRPSHWTGRPVGVFVGAFTQDYLLLQLGDRENTVSTVHSATGVTQTLLSNRLSYCWRLTGPSMTVDTACSSSLVALHLAVNSLAAGESELAFAGGVQLQLSPYYTALESRGGFLSPDGRCRAFDHRANGYVRSEAVGLTLLAPLERALAEGWPVLAVIEATAVNQNGGSVGVTFPSADAQTALIAGNLDRSGLSPDAIGFAEAHGTGTKAGDRAELLALSKTLGRQRRKGPLLVGSVKTNMGHAEAAAGISGLIKSVLSMRRRMIPRHLHWERSPEDLSLDDLGLRLPLETTEWPNDQPYASVSAFGFGGTNAHVILGPAPARRAPSPYRPSRLQPAPRGKLPLVALLSGPTKEHLPLQASAFADFLEAQSEQFDAAAACSAMVYQRDWSGYGLAIAAETRDELIARLRDYCHRPEARAWIQGARDVAASGTAWVFSGMGPQWRGMGTALAAAFPVFAEVLEECDSLYRRVAGQSLLAEVAAYPGDADGLPARLAQPINLFFQIALARLLMSFGLHPDGGVCGHSVGEIAAFHIAGAIDLETAITLIFHRARLLGKLSGRGGMAAVSAGEEVVAPLAQARGMCLAAINSASAVTVSGDNLEIAALLEDLRREGIHAQMLDVDVPYHSALTEQLEAEFRAAIKDLRFSPMRLPLYSTVTGGLLEPVEALEFGEYWWRNLRETVAFLPAFRQLVSEDTCAVLEISAHPVLSAYMQETLGSSKISLIRTLRRHYSETLAFAECLGRVQVSGAAQPDWSALLGSPAEPGSMPAPLPGRQWLKARYWAESSEKQHLRLAVPASAFLGYARSETPDVWDVDEADLISFALTDHVVLGQPRMPMAAFIEMMHAALRQSMPDGTVGLSRLRLHRGVILSGEADARLTTRLDKKSGMVSIWSGQCAAVAEAHCVALRPRILDSDPGEERSSQLDGSPDEVRQDANEFYKNLAALGFDYGPAFRGLRWVRTGPAGAVGLIDGMAVEGCFIPPAVLDAGLQVMLALELDYRQTGGLEERRERLPVSIAGVTFNRAVRDTDFPLTARAVLVRRDACESVADLEIRAAGGALIVRLSAVTAQTVPVPSALRGGQQPRDLVVSLEWKPVDERSFPLPAVKPRRWLIWRDRGGVAAAFGAYLAGRGENVLLADAAVSVVDAYRRLQTSDAAEPLAVVDFQALDWRTLGPIEQLQALALFGRHCAEQAERAAGGSEFWLITRGAHGPAAPDPVQAALWGLGRTLIDAEGDGMWRGLVDLEDTDIGSWSQALLNLVNTRPAQTQFLRREGLWWTPDLVRAPAMEGGGPVWLRPDASYLVTGAFGALGRSSAEYLVDRGARFLVLLGQTPLPPRSAWKHEANPVLRERIDWLNELEARGVRMLLLGFDLADAEACRIALASLSEAGFPAIRGIVHAAGAISDRPLRETRQRDFDHVFGAKVLGLLNVIDALDAVYSDDAKLDLCLVHSSVSGLFPAYGQSAYAAANCYLDAFVRQLEMRGIPALSIGWGPWSVGMAASDRLAQFFALHGLLPITPEEGRLLLADLVSRPQSMLYCAGIDWTKFAQSHRRQVWMFQSLLPDDRRLKQAAVISPKERATLSVAERYRLAFKDLADCAAQISGLPVSTFTEQDVLARKGIDSLMAVELQLLLAERWGREFPLSDILGRSSLGRLADQMAANTT